MLRVKLSGLLMCIILGVIDEVSTENLVRDDLMHRATQIRLTKMLACDE
jgi:hypothetical protein